MICVLSGRKTAPFRFGCSQAAGRLRCQESVEQFQTSRLATFLFCVEAVDLCIEGIIGDASQNARWKTAVVSIAVIILATAICSISSVADAKKVGQTTMCGTL
jgi:hypothetical protein